MFFNIECSEEKREKLRNYLDKHNVIPTITNILNKLIVAKEKPEDPIEFILNELGYISPSQESIEELELELDEVHKEISEIRKLIIKNGLGKLLQEAEADEDDEDEIAPQAGLNSGI